MKQVLLLGPADNVVVAIADLRAGQQLDDAGLSVRLPEPVPLGHKLARLPIAAGTRIVKISSAAAHEAP
ncbi:MAG: hypothetical protein DCF31_13095 [Alphaproteobacteria bacterium]|nr:MAG: hypothetical protein DCF31_13095 [Alphaproteobacteria bacterium]